MVWAFASCCCCCWCCFSIFVYMRLCLADVVFSAISMAQVLLVTKVKSKMHALSMPKNILYRTVAIVWQFIPYYTWKTIKHIKVFSNCTTPKMYVVLMALKFQSFNEREGERRAEKKPTTLLGNIVSIFIACNVKDICTWLAK